MTSETPGRDATMTIMGEEVPQDLRDWEPFHRRMGSLVVIGLASLLVLVGIVVYLLAPGASWVLTLLIILMIVVVAFEALVVGTGIVAEREEVQEHPAAAERATHVAPAPEPEPEPEEPEDDGIQVLTLKCSECGTIFDLEDDGTRPLTHMCPGCGAEGVLEEEDLASEPEEPAPEPEPEEPTVEPEAEEGSVEEPSEGYAGPATEWAARDDTEPASAEDDAPEDPLAAAAPAPEPPKRVKLRCSGCGTVFALEDTGERPLRHRCPGCGKKGKLG